MFAVNNARKVHLGERSKSFWILSQLLVKLTQTRFRGFLDKVQRLFVQCRARIRGTGGHQETKFGEASRIASGRSVPIIGQVHLEFHRRVSIRGLPSWLLNSSRHLLCTGQDIYRPRDFPSWVRQSGFLGESFCLVSARRVFLHRHGVTRLVRGRQAHHLTRHLSQTSIM